MVLLPWLVTKISFVSMECDVCSCCWHKTWQKFTLAIQRHILLGWCGSAAAVSNFARFYVVIMRCQQSNCWCCSAISQQMQVSSLADSVPALAHTGLPTLIYVPQAQHNTPDYQHDSTARGQPAHRQWQHCSGVCNLCSMWTLLSSVMWHPVVS